MYFLTVLGRLCCLRAFSHCCQQELLPLVVAGFSPQWLLFLQSTDSRACGLQELQHLGSVVVTRGLRCSKTCAIFLGQG